MLSWKTTVHKCTGSVRAALSDDAYDSRVELARQVFGLLTPAVTKLLAVAPGRGSGQVGRSRGRAGADVLSASLWDAQATTNLPPDLQSAADEAIETTFLLGLLVHLVIWQFPTRSLTDRVDFDELQRTWLVESLVADQQMKLMFRAGEFPTIDLFEAHYHRVVEPLLSSPLKLGFWGRSKAPSYFRNLLCAGWLLGMPYDLRTEPSNPD